MNILIIPSFFPSSNNDIVGDFAFDQAKALKKRGHNVYIAFCDTFSLKYIKQYKQYKDDEYSERDNIPIVREKKICLYKCYNGIFGCKRVFYKEINKLCKKYYKDVKFDIIHAHGCIWAGYAGMKIAKERNIRFFITEHSSLVNIKYKFLINKTIKKIYSNSKRVIAVSGNLEKEIEKYSNNISVIGNTIDCDLFDTTQDKKEYTFITVFQMNSNSLEKKGVFELLESFSKINEECPKTKLIICGGGRYLEKLKDYSKRKNIKNVYFAGKSTRNEIARYLNKSNIFVLPSHYETFGVSYIEAMSCGLPVIATKCGGPSDFVNKSNGVLIDINNIEELYLAMFNMIKNYSEYNSKKIREFVLENFSEDIIAKKIEQTYYE